ncbi:hypothetical protein K461DRAFT_328916 [Myriangium duriaei CBS 260.36]|uniref:FAM86 N-terminal domain-containing protein n=1 Tax=Myriangium duriaei CBS 260.36 TaxID=1168546 RepID=A0A9P4IY19_9PEZI|nr:hypothetical protein K461DRAFT_328916 [Myriangium duriaei CBS 260.36]
MPLDIFVRQILQLVPFPQLSWPQFDLLRSPYNQHYIWEKCFRPDEGSSLPPVRYRYGVLKLLLRKIENAIVDPDEDEISDDLMNALSELMGEEMPSEVEAAQKRSWVTYTFADAADPVSNANSIRILESRSVIAGSGTTGLRTWEAALHLGQYLLSNASSLEFIKGKTVLELGAGTGFLSMLCAHPLGAKQVLCTDGSEEVTEAVKSNLVWNPRSELVVPGVLRWGWAFKDSILDEIKNNGIVDTVIGADVTYDTSVIPALVSTIRQAFEVWPRADVIISATIRNADTFEAFENACASNGFLTAEVAYPTAPLASQDRLFYSSTVPIRILHVRAGTRIKNPFNLR